LGISHVPSGDFSFYGHVLRHHLHGGRSSARLRLGLFRDNQNHPAVLPHPGMLPSEPGIASPECSLGRIILSIWAGAQNPLSCSIGKPAFPSRPGGAGATARNGGDWEEAEPPGAARSAQLEIVEVDTFPAHGDLDHAMKLAERKTRRH
jgi:hypothetical protein